MLQTFDLASRARQGAGEILRHQRHLLEPIAKITQMMDVQRAQAAKHQSGCEPRARLRGNNAGIGVEILRCRLRRQSIDEQRRTRCQGAEQPAHDTVLARHQQDRDPEGMCRRPDIHKTVRQQRAGERDHHKKPERLRNEPAPIRERHHLGQRRLPRGPGPLKPVAVEVDCRDVFQQRLGAQRDARRHDSTAWRAVACCQMRPTRSI